MKKTDIVQLRLRVRGSLLAELRAKAKRNNIPVNTEIVNRLEASIERAEFEAFLKEVAPEIVALRDEGRDRVGTPPALAAPDQKQKEKK